VSGVAAAARVSLLRQPSTLVRARDEDYA